MENTYNIDEKGFMIRVIGKSVRIFDKQLFRLRRFKLASHDGNRQWVTVVGAIAANGFALPPAVIYPLSSLTVQYSWLKEHKAKKDCVHFSTSLNS